MHFPTKQRAASASPAPRCPCHAGAVTAEVNCCCTQHPVPQTCSSKPAQQGARGRLHRLGQHRGGNGRGVRHYTCDLFSEHRRAQPRKTARGGSVGHAQQRMRQESELFYGLQWTATCSFMHSCSKLNPAVHALLPHCTHGLVLLQGCALYHSCGRQHGAAGSGAAQRCSKHLLNLPRPGRQPP